MDTGAVTVRRWDGPPPTEGEIRRLYRDEGLQPYAWSNGPHDTYDAHDHAYLKVLRVIRGSIRFDLLGSGEPLALGPGDTLVLPSGVVHSAVVGPDGVTCLEAHRYQ